jgi:Ca-activated chloride channel homolog
MRRAILASVFLAAAGAQSPQPASDETGFVFRAEARLVVCHTTVVDKEGKLITDLQQPAFKVYENGAPQEIKIFRHEDIPVSMGLVIDNSGSMREKRARVEAAALTLAKDSNPEDEVFIVNFNEEAFLDTPPGKNFTSDIKEMEESLKRLDSRGSTVLFDALRMSIDHVKEKGRKDKRVLVVVTDGGDNASAITLEKLVRAAQQSDVLIYCVGILGDDEPRETARAKRALNELAASSGGEAFFPTDIADVDRIAHQVARDIRNQYTIEYTPANTSMDGTFRQIKITVDRPELTVRTRNGYYASPEQSLAAKPKAKP